MRESWTAACATVVAVFITVLGSPLPGGAAGVTPPSNPAANVPANPDIAGEVTCTTTGTGHTSCTNPCMTSIKVTYVDTPKCVHDALRAIDRAHKDEGIGPMVLPSNWYSLTADEQIFVVSDMERRDRGIPVILGLSSALDVTAQTGANTNNDPTDSSVPYSAWASIWAGGDVNPLAADYAWMEEDGWGGSRTTTSNYDCTGPSASGCWGHRDNILAYSTCTTCVAGTGYTATGTYGPSYAAIFVKPTGSVALAFTWSRDVAPDLARPITATGTSTPTWKIGSKLPVGYWIFSSGGSLYNFGNARLPGSVGLTPPSPTVGMAVAPGGKGYWELERDGAIFSFGSAKFHGGANTGGSVDAVACLTDTKTGGYWIVLATGNVERFDAPRLGSAPHVSRRSASRLVGGASTPTGGGYWLVGATGRVRAFGDAKRMGTVSGRAHASIVGMATTVNGTGYWLAASDGAVYSYGKAPFDGSMGGKTINSPVTGIAADPKGGGYWEVGRDGGLYTFGRAPFYGSLGRLGLTDPVIGITGS